MIVQKQEETLRCVTQADHAAVAAEMLRLWRADGLPEHPRRDDLLFAVREHDNGWQETDAAPLLDPSRGRPYDFTELPEHPRQALWLRGIRRHAEAHPYSTLLIARHAWVIHEDRRSLDGWSEFFAQVTELEQTLVEQLGEETCAGVDEDYAWLRLADLISLCACGALSDRFELGDRSVQRRTGEVVIDPFPLAGATTFTIACREIPDRLYSSDTDLAVELASARWTSFSVRLIGG